MTKEYSEGKADFWKNKTHFDDGVKKTSWDGNITFYYMK